MTKLTLSVDDKVLDVNVVLDFVLDRPPFAEAASTLWASAERKESKPSSRRTA